MNEDATATALEVYQPDMVQNLVVVRPPDVVLAEAREAAKALKEVIDRKPKKVQFNGESYLEFEDWTTVARFYGVTVRVRSTGYVEYGSAHGFEAIADAIDSRGTVRSTAEACCLDDEPNWSSKPLFQIKSMAQTRASAKALRQLFAWVVVLAGYRPTPSEEMTGQDNKGTEEQHGNGQQAQASSGARTCPKCGEAAVFKSKKEEGWYCWKKPEKGFNGCGLKFKTEEELRGKPSAPQGKPDVGPTITVAQQKMLYTVGRTFGWTDDNVKTIVQQHGYGSSAAIPQAEFDEILSAVKTPKLDDDGAIETGDNGGENGDDPFYAK